MDGWMDGCIERYKHRELLQQRPGPHAIPNVVKFGLGAIGELFTNRAGEPTETCETLWM